MRILKPVQIPGILIKDIGGEILLYSAEEKEIHVLNPTAKLIWDLCDGKHTIEDMARVLKANFAVSEAHDVVKDIERTLAVFADKGLVQQSM